MEKTGSGTTLIPAIIQDFQSGQVLMLGYMNEEALAQTRAGGMVCFYSRSKQRLWVKGESSGNFLRVKEIKLDCDADTLLIRVQPMGPVCHTGDGTCFGESQVFSLAMLESIITDRKKNPRDNSYTSTLFKKGINKIAQKLGEEAVELVIESKDEDQTKFLGEAADLLFHYLVLLQAKGTRLEDVVELLGARAESEKIKKI